MRASKLKDEVSWSLLFSAMEMARPQVQFSREVGSLTEIRNIERGLVYENLDMDKIEENKGVETELGGD